MSLFASGLIAPLRVAENHFLEALVTRFTLSRTDQGSQLRVSFDDETPTIWTRHGKYDAQRLMPDFRNKAAKYQKKLDAFLLENEGPTYEFDDPDFAFRYASGGVLPILSLGSEEALARGRAKRRKPGEYYCLFYRDISPIGWNIANGGCDSRNELVNPLDTMQRELREELIVIDKKKQLRYVFEGDEGKSVDRPEFAVARKFWETQAPNLDMAKLQEARIPVRWLDGPDSLIVQDGAEPEATVTGCFLNINAEDFGIEVDKVANIRLGADVVLCDGEITQGLLVNRVVGLFEVDRLARELERGATEFLPDRFFFDGEEHDPRTLSKVLKERFEPHIRRARTQHERVQQASCQAPFDLCPVTRRILKRYLASVERPRAVPTGDFEAFVSFGGADVDLARAVHRFLEAKRIRTFFSPESLDHPDVLRAINNALDSARCLVVVGSSRENVERPWPKYEWESFFQSKLREPGAGRKIVTLISGCEKTDLPRPLWCYEVVEAKEGNIEAALQKLARFVP